MLQEPSANTWDQWVSIISMANITRVHHPPSWLLSHIRKLNLLVFLWEIYYVPLLLLLVFFSFTICNTLEGGALSYTSWHICSPSIF